MSTVMVISLESLYRVIKQSHQSSTLPPALPKRGTPEYRRYSKHFQELFEDIKAPRAVYLWYAVRADGSVEYIYVGETSNGRNGLGGRFSDHFKQGYHIFWMTAFKTETYISGAINMYQGKDYTSSILNQALRNGVTHIAFAKIDEGVDTRAVEKDLIQLFGNPRGNDKDKRKMPAPEKMLLPIAKSIRMEFIRLAKATPFYDPASC